MKFEDLYYEEITKESYVEMVELCKWLNEVYGYHPVIIGGWAVHFHYPTLGSRDIDILFSERRLKNIVVDKYLGSHGYQSEGLFTKEYFKEVKTKAGIERIIIDACSVEDINRMKGTDIIIPWALAFEHQKGFKTENVELYIPSVEVLLLFKSKAVLDRTEDLKEAFDPFYLQQKILKDYLDIVNLIINCEIDFSLLNDLLNKHSFHNYFISVCEMIETKKEILNRYEDWNVRKNEFINKLNSIR
jgi:hypothetical protein